MRKKIRYAVVGLGHIAQNAVLPAFKHAKENSELTALVSGDDEKLKKMGKKYSVKQLYHYSQYNECLASGAVDAVYICTPNTLHHNFTKTAARHGVHVLCEKPMATDEKACIDMIESARRHNVRLMIAYRLHFEAANLHAIDFAVTKRLGDLKVFNSIFTMQVRDLDNIRLKAELGGGTLFDIGIYCINAARYLFQDEPIEAMAIQSSSSDRRFRDVDEITSAILRFPGGRHASFSVSFGAADSSAYDLLGAQGRLRLENAYQYAERIRFEFVGEKKTEKKIFRKRDQFGPELIYFSDCILNNREPEPSGWEGLADVRIIQALLHSAKIGAAVKIQPVEKKMRPRIEQKINRPPVRSVPKEIHATAPRRAG